MESEQTQQAEIVEDGCYVALTHAHLKVQEIMDRVRSPQAGAIVLFAGEPATLLLSFFFFFFFF
jgi:molybdopterin synthase catalytic subunit